MLLRITLLLPVCLVSCPAEPHFAAEPHLNVSSAAGPTTGLDVNDVAGPSSGGEGTSVASAGAGSEEMGVGGLSSRVGEETGSTLEDIPGTGGEETTAETTAVDSTPRTSQDILGDFTEDWLETLDKNKINFYVITLCMHFPLLKLKLQSMLHP